MIFSVSRTLIDIKKVFKELSTGGIRILIVVFVNKRIQHGYMYALEVRQNKIDNLIGYLCDSSAVPGEKKMII